MSNVPLAVHVVQFANLAGKVSAPLTQGQGPPVRARPLKKAVFSRSEKGKDKKRPLNAQITIKLRSHCPSQLVLIALPALLRLGICTMWLHVWSFVAVVVY